MNRDTYQQLSSTCNAPANPNSISPDITCLKPTDVGNPMGGLFNSLSSEAKAAMWGAMGIIGVVDTLFNRNNSNW